MAEDARATTDQLYHLVQDEDLIRQIHEHELPPDEYYARLRSVLEQWFPTATPELLDHGIPCVAAFDTACAPALSSGAPTFKLAQQNARWNYEISQTTLQNT